MSKKRKIDSENRVFQPEWTHKYCFIIHKDKPTCLVCTRTVGLIKTSNIKRHYETLHQAATDRKYPLGSEERNTYIKQLEKSLNGQVNVMAAYTSSQNRATRASLHISEIIGKSMLAYSTGETIKDCIVAAAEVMFPTNPDVSNAMKTISLSRNTITRRMQDISDDLNTRLHSAVASSQFYSLAIDESTDVEDVAQLSIFVRYDYYPLAKIGICEIQILTEEHI